MVGVVLIKDLPKGQGFLSWGWRNRGFLSLDSSILDDKPGAPVGCLLFIPRPPREKDAVCPNPLVRTVDAERDLIRRITSRLKDLRTDLEPVHHISLHHKRMQGWGKI